MARNQLMRTFYIAGSSKNREDIADLGTQLYHYGLRWCSDWVWPNFDAKAMVDPKARAGVVCGDIAAAIGADLFVLYTKPSDPPSMGWGEYVARVSHSKEAHVIHHGGKNVFWAHPLARSHETWDDFLTWIISDAGLEHRRLPSARLPKAI